MTLSVTSLVAGHARGPVLWLSEPISFWGGVDPETGRIIEAHHPQAGRCVTGTVLALPHARGSSSSPSVLAEMIRTSTAPAAVVLGQADPLVVLGALVAAELYSIAMPVVVLADSRLAEASEAQIEPEGRLILH